MPTIPIRIGVPELFLSVSTNTACPSVVTSQVNVYTQTATIGGTATSGDELELTFTSSGISGSPVTVSTSVTSAEATSAMASALNTAIGNSTPLSTAGVTSTVNGSVVTVQWPSSLGSGIMSKTVTGSATETITLGTALDPSFTATGLEPVDDLINDPVQPLLSTDTYSVTLALVGEDHTNQGYTAGPAIDPVTGISVTTGEGIYLHISNSAWPSGFSGAICAAVFLQINNGNYYLADFAYIDPLYDFNFMIWAKPLRVAPSWTLATIQASTVDPILGSRAPYQVTYEQITPTTGTFNFRRPVVNVQVSPNNSPDFQVATARGTGIQFEALTNDIKTFVQAAAGVYRLFQGDNSQYIYNANMSLNTAQAVLRGNKSIQVLMPPDADGNQEIRLVIGTLTFNQVELTEAWSKSATTSVRFQFDPASLDALINSSHTEINYLRSSISTF